MSLTTIEAVQTDIIWVMVIQIDMFSNEQGEGLVVKKNLA